MKKGGGCYVIVTGLALFLFVIAAIIALGGGAAGIFDPGGMLESVNPGAFCIGAVVIVFVILIIAVSIFD